MNVILEYSNSDLNKCDHAIRKYFYNITQEFKCHKLKKIIKRSEEKFNEDLRMFLVNEIIFTYLFLTYYSNS